jgi:hypothetical protein
MELVLTLRHALLKARSFPCLSFFPSSFDILENTICKLKPCIDCYLASKSSYQRRVHLQSSHQHYPSHMHISPLITHIASHTYWILLNARDISRLSSNLYKHIFTALAKWMPKIGKRSRGKVKSGPHLQTPSLKLTTDRDQDLPDQAVAGISHTLHLQIVCKLPRVSQRNPNGNPMTQRSVSCGTTNRPSPANRKSGIGKNAWCNRQRCLAAQALQSSGMEYTPPIILVNTSLLIVRGAMVSMSRRGILP